MFWATLGPPLPQKIGGHSMIEMNGDLIVLGGYSNSLDSRYQRAIYKLICTSGSCAWTTMNQRLKIPRQLFVVIPIIDSMVSCL